MGRELYQLVAFDKNNKEYVIELNNENNNDRGQLSFLDAGITRFQNEQHLAAYLYEAKKIPTHDVRFFIKYCYKGARYLPLIFYDRELNIIIRDIDNEEKYSAHVLRLYTKIEVELYNLDFYNYLLLMNETNVNQKGNGNYLNAYIMKNIIKLVEEFIRYDVPTSEKVEIQYDIMKSLTDYKQLRTLHYFYQSYVNQYSKGNGSNLENNNCDRLLGEKEITNTDIPEELQKAYDQNGMDGVWAIADSEEIIRGGYKFK